MGAMGWYYNAGNGVYYWTTSGDMSATQFAREVGSIIGKSLSASDVSEVKRQSEFDAMKKRASQAIYLS